ncbi:hypothetical protein [Mesobacillus harenae]|uniref:hypothetical protein n=1 Tax=Mesobacillus harenae TaxID=2213203 RepID=UPI001581082C|nr:hypothetical protein [Mesobacillus harenae]
MLSTIIMAIVLVLVVFAVIAAWLNTQLILKDLAMIKQELGIKDIKNPSFLDDDLDKN